MGSTGASSGTASETGAPRTVGAAPRVVVVGSVNVDVVVRVPRLPAPGQTVTGGTSSRTPGGKGGNQAVAAARLGARVHLVARVGDDGDGRGALADLRAEGVGTEHVLALPGEATGLAAVLVDDASENCIAVASGANHRLTAADVRAALGDLGPAPAVVLACLEVPLDAVTAAAEVARELGWPVVLNPAPAQPLPPQLLALVDVLTPNEHELAELSPDGAGPLLDAGVGWVVTTRGAHGVEVASADREPLRLPAEPVAAVDTTGAGDTFSGTLAAALAGGADVPEAVRSAVVAAALATTAAGARGGMPDGAALRAVMDAAHGRSGL